MAERNDFYEEDEPIEKIMEIWKKAKKGLTAPRSDVTVTDGDTSVDLNFDKFVGGVRLSRKAGTYRPMEPAA